MTTIDLLPASRTSYVDLTSLLCTRRKKRTAFALTLCMVLIFAMHTNKNPSKISTSVPLNEAHKELAPEVEVDVKTHGGRLLFIYTQPGNCYFWKKALPHLEIVIVGESKAKKEASLTSDGMCTYAETSEHFSAIFKKFGAQDVVVAQDDGPSAVTCVHNLLRRTPQPRRYSVMYKNPAESFYQTKRHFGCGGVPHGSKFKPYELCHRPNTTGLVISVADKTMSCEVYPPMGLVPGVYSLSQLQCAWIPKSSYWIVPFLGRPLNNAQIARTMVMEKLVWSTGQHVEVLPPRRDQTAPIHMDHAIVHSATKPLAEQLSSVSCTSTSLKKCLKTVSVKLGKVVHFSNLDYKSFEDWLSHLEISGFQLPKANPASPTGCLDRALDSYLSPKDEGQPVVNQKQSLELRDSTCKNGSIIKGSNADTWLQFKDTLLIVTFNRNEHYDSIPYFDTIYRKFFPHVLYCGPIDPKLDKEKFLGFSISFMSDAATPKKRRQGAMHYECLIQASRMGYNVQGYLETSDDILMNVHRFRHYDTKKAWHYQFNNMIRVHTFNHTSCDDVGCKQDDRNDKFWHQFRGVTAGAITELSSATTPAAERCNRNREKLYGGLDWHVRIISDTTYIPARYVEDVASVLEIFLRHEVYLEIAVPTVLHCIIPQDQFEPLYMDLHNFENPIYGPYSHTVLKPSNPDVVILNMIEHPEMFRYPPRKEPWGFINPQYLRGLSIFHGHKLGNVIKGVQAHIDLYCNVMRFFGDETGNAAQYFAPLPRV